MVAAFYHEQTVDIEGEPIRFVLDFAAIDATESLLGGRGYDTILADMMDGTAPLAVQAKVLWGLLRRHHPELSLDQATTLLFGRTGLIVGASLGTLINAAFPTADPEKAKGENPRKPRGASPTSSPRGARKA
jgi:hypothetical protein